MSAYTVPAGNSVIANFNGLYQAPAGHSLTMDFTPSSILLDPITFNDGSSVFGSLLCGIWKSIPGNQIGFTFKDDWTSIDGNKIQLAWNCPVLILDCPEMWHDLPGDHADFYFDSKYISSIPGDNINFSFSCEGSQPSQDLILGNVLANEGSLLTAPLQETLNLQFQDGAIFVPIVEFINTYLPMEFDEGAIFTFVVATLPYLYPTALDGAIFIADFTQSAIAFMSCNQLDGAITTANLWTQSYISQEFNEGAILNNFDLTTIAAITFDGTQTLDGAILTASLTTVATFPSEFDEGAILTFDLATIVNQGIPTEFDEGAIFTFNLYNVQGFPSEFDDGAIVTSDLSATYGLSVEFDDGAIFIADITPNPNVPFPVEFDDGAITIADLATTTSFQFEFDDGAIFAGDITLDPATPWPLIQFNDGAILTSSLNAGTQNFIFFMQDGAIFTGDFTPNPSANIALEFDDGAIASINVSFAQNLGNFQFLDGSIVIIPLIDSNPIIFAYDGAELDADLATQTTFPAFIQEGAVATLDIDLRPSSGIGSFQVLDGAVFQFGALATLVSAQLAVVFRNTYDVSIDLPGSSKDFDLIQDLNGRNNTGAIVDVDGAPVPGTHYWGYKQVFTADLSCRPRFSAQMFDGSVFTSKDYSAYFNFQFLDGASSNLVAFDSNLNIKLCKGNFIPDGNNIVVELVFTENENCDVNFAYEGAQMTCVLDNNVQMLELIQEGAVLSAILTTYQPWFFQFWDGAQLNVGFPAEMSVNMLDGAVSSFTFHPDSYQIWEGAVATCGGLSTNYNVEFLEIGCLDNEFIPMDANGDPEPQLAHTVPMEMDPYYHEIKARCF